MTNVERNLAYNALTRIRLEWKNEESPIDDATGFYSDMLNDARGILAIQLGREKVEMWNESSYELEPKSIEGYLIELGAVREFMETCIAGKNPEVVAFDRMAADIIGRLENFLDGLIGTEGDAGADADEGAGG